METRQINNLRLRLLRSGKTGAFSPSGVLLEEFKSPSDAVSWASKTTDFVRRAIPDMPALPDEPTDKRVRGPKP